MPAESLGTVREADEDVVAGGTEWKGDPVAGLDQSPEGKNRHKLS
jgi:hypothetical protein